MSRLSRCAVGPKHRSVNNLKVWRFVLSCFVTLAYLEIGRAIEAGLPELPFTNIELHFQICGADGVVLREEDLDTQLTDSHGSPQRSGRRLAPNEVLAKTLKSLKLSPEGAGTEVLKSQTVFFLDAENGEGLGNQGFFKSRNLILRVREKEKGYMVSIKNRVPVTRSDELNAVDIKKRDFAIAKLFEISGNYNLGNTNKLSCEFDFIKTKLSMSCTSSAEFKKEKSGKDSISQIIRRPDEPLVAMQMEKPLEIVMGRQTEFGDFLNRIVGPSEAMRVAGVRLVGSSQRTFWKWKEGTEERVFENWSAFSSKDDIAKLVSDHATTVQGGPSEQTIRAKPKDFRLPQNGQPSQMLEYSTRMSLSLPPSNNAEHIAQDIGKTARLAWQRIAVDLERKGLILCDSPVSKTEFSAGGNL